MKILLEVIENHRLEIVDLDLSHNDSAKQVLKEASAFDTQRILQFDPQSMTIEDVSARFVHSYDGPLDDTAPEWLKQLSFFDQLVEEDRLEAKEWADHIRSLRHAA